MYVPDILYFTMNPTYSGSDKMCVALHEEYPMIKYPRRDWALPSEKLFKIDSDNLVQALTVVRNTVMAISCLLCNVIRMIISGWQVRF